MVDGKKTDFRRFSARFCHVNIDGDEWFLFKDEDRYFFSVEDPPKGEPCALPKGYKVIRDKKTGIPRIEKDKSVSENIDEFFAKDEKKEDLSKYASKKRSSEKEDLYRRFKY